MPNLVPQADAGSKLQVLKIAVRDERTALETNRQELRVEWRKMQSAH